MTLPAGGPSRDSGRRWKDAVWRALGLLHHLRGTRVYEAHWKHRNYDEDAVVRAWDHPHRPWLAGQVRALGDLMSVLEIGCGSGANVAALARMLPRATVTGVDVNDQAVTSGNRRLMAEDIHNAKLLAGSALDLRVFHDREFDVVLTDATLLYVGPDQIRRVIAEMARIARCALFVLELHRPELQGNRGRSGIHTRDGWCRNYEALFHELFPSAATEVTKVPDAAWSTGRWPMYGYGVCVRFAFPNGAPADEHGQGDD